LGSSSRAMAPPSMSADPAAVTPGVVDTSAPSPD
jgi:hypothetical protein